MCDPVQNEADGGPMGDHFAAPGTCFIAFERNRGNVGTRQPREGMDSLRAVWNRRLAAERAGIRVAMSYGHTGNFIVHTDQPVTIEDVIRPLSDVLERRFAVFPDVDYLRWLDGLRRAALEAPSMGPGRRATPGVVMDLDPYGGIPGTPPSTDRVAFGVWAVGRVRVAWKGDLLRGDGMALDARRREGVGEAWLRLWREPSVDGGRPGRCHRSKELLRSRLRRRIGKEMKGRHNSSITRGRPVFERLIRRDPTGNRGSRGASAGGDRRSSSRGGADS
jgi:hypothetical protein